MVQDPLDNQCSTFSYHKNSKKINILWQKENQIRQNYPMKRHYESGHNNTTISGVYANYSTIVNPYRTSLVIYEDLKLASKHFLT